MTLFLAGAGRRMAVPGPASGTGDEAALESLRREIVILGQAREHWLWRLETAHSSADPSDDDAAIQTLVAVEKALQRAVRHAAGLSPSSARGLLLQGDILLTLTSMRQEAEQDDGLADLAATHMVAIAGQLSRMLPEVDTVETANDRSADLYLVALARRSCSLLRVGTGEHVCDEQAFLDAQRSLDETLNELAIVTPITALGVTALADVLVEGLDQHEGFEARPWFDPMLFNILSATSQLLDPSEPASLVPAPGHHGSPVRIAPA